MFLSVQELYEYKLNALFDITQKINSEFDEKELLELFCEKLERLIEVQSVRLFMYSGRWEQKINFGNDEKFSRSEHDFLQFEERGTTLEMILQQGINLSKLDKGCLIFNYKKEEGYKILSVDSNRYDARYWLEHFLSVDAFQDENFITKKYLKFCQGFAKDVVFPAEDKKQEVMFMNRSVNYFAKNDQFEESNFLNEVMDNPDLIPEFRSYKVDKGEKYSIEDVTTFPIANSAVSDARKSIKNVINLDTHIQIKMDFINPESAEKFVEKGWDEEKQMYYYLVYFNKEQKS
mgnify:CR=1 FL=1